MTPLLEVQKLCKQFGGRTVLREVSFTLFSAEAAVLSGPNGSGKSTLLRIVAGLLPPDSGTVRLLDEDSDFSGAARGGLSRRIGLVPERMPILRFSPVEYLTHMGAVRGMDKRQLRARAGELLALCGLEQAKDAPIRFFSKGMLQKVGIMQAMLEQPALLLMDEPFSGLDVAAQEDLIRILRELQSAGTGLLFASHEPVLAGRVANRQLVLDGQGAVEMRELEPPVEMEQWVMVRSRGVDWRMAAEIAVRQGKGCPWRNRDGEIWFQPRARFRDKLLLAVLQAGGEVLAVQAVKSGVGWAAAEPDTDWTKGEET
ncbi:MAG: transporter ATP-binding protein [Paenibacillaceae bacterium]|jgi:ABC-type multidrug transport system ATPase subunit|nr:transporter ATP-binding protein [Paenibacillaceae bacterium]